MELLSLLKPRQLGFIYDEQHKFKPDNPEVKCVFVPSTVQYNPPIFCPFALITKTSSGNGWNAETYTQVAKVSQNKQISSLYAHNTEKISFNIIQTLYSVLSPLNRMVVINEMSEKPSDQKMNEFITFLSSNPERCEYFQTKLDPSRLSSHSIIVIPKNSNYKDFIKDLSQFEIIVEFGENQHQRVYTYSFEGVKIFSNKPLFALIDRYKELQLMKIKILSLRDKPNRRKNLIDQLQSQQLNYDIVYGFDGKCCNVELFSPPDISVKPGKHLFTIKCGNETFIYDPSIRGNAQLMTYGEIGCAISHLRIYDSIKDEDTLTLIFEDDAHFDNFDRFYFSLRQIPPVDSFDVVYLQNEATWWPPIMDKAINDCFFQTKKGTSSNLCLALLLTPNAKRMIQYFHQLVQQQSLMSPLPNKYKFLCLPADDLISHAARANLLRGISPFIRSISTQHLPSHINMVTDEVKSEKKVAFDKAVHYFTDVLIENCNDVWTGMGNQMFQYAVAKLYSLLVKKELVAKKEGCKLFIAFDNIEIGNVKENKSYLKIKEEVNHELISSLVNPSFETVKDKNISISGFLQHAGYFKGNEYIVREMFRFKKEIQLASSQYIQTIKNMYPEHKLVAVHIRRRDFKGETCEFLYDLYTPSSLVPKLEKLEELVQKPFVYVIFSNDIQEVEQTFSVLFKSRGKPFLFIETPPSQLGPHKNGCLEMCLMKDCDHFIISASSYSWWGAFLSNSKDKVVIIPKVWYNPKREDVCNLDTSGFKFDNWICL